MMFLLNGLWIVYGLNESAINTIYPCSMHGLNGQSVSSSPFECAMHLRTPALFSSPYTRCNKSGEILTSYLGRRNIFQKTRRKTGPVGKGQPPRYAHLRGPTLLRFLLSIVVGEVAVQVFFFNSCTSWLSGSCSGCLRNDKWWWGVGHHLIFHEDAFGSCKKCISYSAQCTVQSQGKLNAGNLSSTHGLFSLHRLASYTICMLLWQRSSLGTK